MIPTMDEIYQSEIFQQSQCIWHENKLIEFFRSLLIQSGYVSQGSSDKTYKKQSKTIVVCFADDIQTEAHYPYDEHNLFEPNTTVITDNFVSHPTTYQVYQLPDSYFGIYFYRPQDQSWQPDRRFNINMNRIDANRLCVLFEYVKRFNVIPWQNQSDYINFNCFDGTGNNDHPDAANGNFEKFHDQLQPHLKTLYSKQFDILKSNMPIKNYSYEFDQSWTRSWLNVVIETYHGYNNIALSEKIFRALVTPVPWAVYGPRFAVRYLKSLGFDVLDDILSHEYDTKAHLSSQQLGDKIVDFMNYIDQTTKQLQSHNQRVLSARCQQAAIHNQNLLFAMRKKWPKDFAQWFLTLSEEF